jgi:hypothetical protein
MRVRFRNDSQLVGAMHKLKLCGMDAWWLVRACRRPGVWGGTGGLYRSLLSASEIADTKPRADHAQPRLLTGHLLRMTVLDPLLSFEPSMKAGLRGWAVAAAIIARLQQVGRSEAFELTAILGPVIADLSESELEELARQVNGPLMDTDDAFLGVPISCDCVSDI